MCYYMSMQTNSYDESKDKCIHDAGIVFEDQYTQIQAQIYAYGDKGKPKLQLTRKKFDKKRGEWLFAKLGRMTYDEFAAVARAAKEGFDKV
jgi:hypothetical protein